jgi:ABC-type phosphate/phosphonate transport system substrate-binding protein
MSEFVAALPMYDWPEARAGVDAEWARLRDLLRGQGIDAPERLARRNADLPAVPGGIRNAEGAVVAPDPATLPPDQFDLPTLWRHPKLLLAQTCWGPMELGLFDHVQVVWQPDYSAYEGGQGELYSSAIVMRRHSPAAPSGFPEGDVQAPNNGKAFIPLNLLRGARFAFNSHDSMSGIMALTCDLQALGPEIFSERIETGSHRASVSAVAEERADVCAIDCRSWNMIGRYQPDLAGRVQVVGWTALRKGLPLITAVGLPASVAQALRSILDGRGA